MNDIFNVVNKLGQIAQSVIPNNIWALAIPFILGVGIFKAIRSF